MDPSVIAQTGRQTADIAGAQVKGLTLADLYRQDEVGKMDLAAKKSGAADMSYAKDILSKADLSSLDGQNKAVAEITKRSPELGMKLMRDFQSGRKDKSEADAAQLDLYSKKNDVIGGAVVSLKTQHDELIRSGKNEAEVNAAMMPQVMQTVQGLVQAKLPDGTPVLNDQDRQWIGENLKNGYNPQAIDQLVQKSTQAKQAIATKLSERKQDTAEGRADEAERHNRAMESQGQQRVDLNKEKIKRDSSGGLTTESAQFLAEQAEAGDTTALVGLKSADKVKVRNVMADNAAIRGGTGADQAAKNAEFAGVKAGQRTLGQRQANIDMAVQEAQNILPILRDASKAVPRGKWTSWNKMFQIADGQVSDPELLQFAQAAKSFANIYTRATVPGASSVFDREEAVKHLPIFTSDESFEKVLDIMEKEMAAAKASPHSVRQDLSDSVTGSDRHALPTSSTPASGAAGGTPPPAAASGAGGGHPPPPPGFKVTG